MPIQLSRILAISIIALSLSGSVALAAQPTLPPPDGNVPAPINVGTAAQSKNGTFGSLLGGFWDLLGLNSVLFTGATSVNPVSGACPSGYSWVDENSNGAKDNGECNVISFFAGSNGNVGIGTTNPGAKLEVIGDISVNPASVGSSVMRIRTGGSTIGGIAGSGAWKGDSSTDMAMFAETGKQLRFYSGGLATERMVIDSSGNVGIGTATPGTYKLSVNGGPVLFSNEVYMNGLWSTTYGPRNSGDPIKFTNWAGGELARIDTTTGNVGIGEDMTSKRWGPKYTTWSGIGDGGAAIVNSNEPSYKALMIVGSEQGTGAGRVVKVWDNLQVQGPFSATTGTFTGSVTASSFLYSSDLNLKKNIVPLSGQLEKISQLQGVSFDWKKDDKHSLGLIAQEVEKVYPDLVSTDKTTGLKAVHYGNLVAPLIEAVKEQQKQIDALKAEIENLKK
ncbi:MAG: tail fiber domain-containing protein [Patescibacteria group bacterium]